MSFERSGVQIVRGALDRQTVELLDTQFTMHRDVEMLAAGKRKDEFRGDDQTPTSFASSGGSIFDPLLPMLKPLMERVTGKNLLPTYSYARIYYNGSVLGKHKDRPSCQYSATVCIAKDGTDWPILIRDHQGIEHSVELNPGDLLVYHGTELEHWRDKYDGYKHTQVFIHYVDALGEYKDFCFDGRQTLGVTEKRSGLEKFIIEIPNLVPPDLCNEIVAWSKDKKWEQSSVDKGEIKKDVRNCKTMDLHNSPYDNKLFNYVSKALQEYSKKFDYMSVSKDTGYSLLKYEEGGFYKEHVDSYDVSPRILTLSIIMNNQYEGGDWSFFGGKYTLSPNMGSAVIFPSNFMYPHAILPITSGVRYAVITWFV